MKIQLKHMALAALLVVLPVFGWNAFAQYDPSCADCVVSGVLDKLPAESQSDLDALMSKLATLPDESVRLLADLLAPAEEGENSLYEYALNGITAYASAPGREDLAAVVKDALFESVDGCQGEENKAFLLSLARLLSGPEDAVRFEAYLSDGYLRPFAAGALITLPDIDGEILSLVKGSPAPDAALARIVEAKGISKAEKYLLKWIPSEDSEVREAVYAALGSCGGVKSVDALAAAALEDGYGLGSSNATESYLRLVRRLVQDGQTRGFDEAEMLLHSEYTHVRINALDILLHSDRVVRGDLVLAALQDEDRQYRRAALFIAGDFADEGLYDDAAALMPNLGDGAKADIVAWFGENHVPGHIAEVVAGVSSGNAELAAASIKAAGRIGGPEALNALASCLGGPYTSEAETALASFAGDVDGAVLGHLNGSPTAVASALRLAGRRSVTAAADRVFELTLSDDPQVRVEAFRALAGVCTAGDFGRLCDLLDTCGDTYVPDVQAAAVIAARGVEYPAVSGRLEASANPERYYPLLADNGSREAVAVLTAAARDGSDPAFLSLLGVHADIAGEIVGLGALKDAWRDGAAARACALISEYGGEDTSAGSYAGALDLHPSAEVTSMILRALGDGADTAGIGMTLPYTDDPGTMEAAAYAIKSLVSKHQELLGDDAAEAALLRAREVYSELAAHDPDAGYAVDEIDGLLGAGTR